MAQGVSISRWAWPCVLTWFGVVMLLAAATGPPDHPVASLGVLAFLFVCPGMAVVRMLRLRDRLTELVLAVAVSVALLTASAMVFMYAGGWFPRALLGALATVSFLGGVTELVRSAYADAAERR